MEVLGFEGRFKNNMNRHPDVTWEEVAGLLEEHPDVLKKLEFMEKSGGEPDVIGRDETTGKLIICDCSVETPKDRRSLCYDEAGLRARKKNPPAGSAKKQAELYGIQMLNQELYNCLQILGDFDLKTSSWIDTPEDIRNLGGALFCERRYGTVFTFHNSADSYYSVRGWRGYFLL